MLQVGIIGATGMVGQQFVSLLQGHPWFSVSLLAASQRSAGLSYAEAVNGRWKLTSPVPLALEEMPVIDAQDIGQIRAQCDLVFCAVDLGKEETIQLENSYAAAGLPVFSNNSAQRGDPLVPMIIPEVNPEHLQLIRAQKENCGYSTGFVVVKPNCSLQSYVPVLGALQEFQPDNVIVTTFQAISGAGKLLEEVPDLLDNCIPLPGEENKSELEPLKILGSLIDDRIVNPAISISAQCHRVPTSNGHLAAVSVKFRKPVTPAEAIVKLKNFAGEPQRLGLPSAPVPCFTYFDEDDRPQVKLDRNTGKGMGFAIGRLRICPVLDLKFLTLSHNTVRERPGGAILTAELAYKSGLVGKS